MEKKISQMDLVKGFFTKNPNRNIEHPEVVDWVVAEWKKRTGEVFRDPDRAIRSLSQKGFLVKIAKGVYRYDPNLVQNKKLEDFTPAQKKTILKRDGYKCVRCGKTKKDGVELQIDHIIAKDRGGKATIENGEVLCSQCNFKKKNYNQTETGKKMFINFYELSKQIGDTKNKQFFEAILNVFEEFGVNGHIEWKK
ncbi:MAG: HNH endonuclease [Prevotellaceae bacterium]|jgi:DNA-directed RNA polymerase subunit RPC12/RpoP|nr:HNH endonuclease [Prevotellaceae bacterium]